MSKRHVLFPFTALALIVVASLWFIPGCSKGDGNSGDGKLPQSDVASLRAENGDYLLVPGSPDLSVKIYNGSPWTIRQVTLHVQLFDNPGGALIFDANVALPLDDNETGEPFKTSTFKGKNVWPKTEYRRARNLGITGAYGVRADSK